MEKEDRKEYCQFKWDDRAYLQSVLSLICKNCGFNEVTSNLNGYRQPRMHQNILQQTTGRQQQTANFIKPNSPNSKSLTTNFYNLFKTRATNNKTQQPGGGVNNLNKSIAGVAALSVGSYDLCHAKLDSIFDKENNNHDRKPTSKYTENDGYLKLDECVSGTDNESEKREEVTKNSLSPPPPPHAAFYTNSMASSYHSDIIPNENDEKMSKNFRRNSVS